MNKVGKWLRRKCPKLYYKISRLDKCKSDEHEYDCMNCNKAADCNRYIDLGIGHAQLRMIGNTCSAGKASKELMQSIADELVNNGSLG